jgi:hypothetical protein
MHGVNEPVAFLCGLGGGVVPELVGLYKDREQPQLPVKFKSWVWWLGALAMIAAGGGLAVLYAASDNQLSPLLAVNVGASAPLILASLTSITPAIAPGKID